ncbi:hypothetical protein AAZX31_07G114100 [Glycine max]|uniref:RING-type E3 ubiquitin transferase n=2 Tax=Glycine subgen. Soja TaxID=1462606 RepID=K7L126_SOYBN|nr:E3 ubiquitin-protein ligase ATL4 [Glycine max]XP_028240145.1 E3 ubiquitin-protein ligase ATL4-like [Glycine soja]KAG5022393.1 hypothetical protein JHK85_018735 [Glycine max]KAG5037496.1 hypothetical protein JHK86_018336 [Glycine max]KAG5142615.1 hypothetical protein JHK82_018310 [Glycine max]KAH1086493.1 hypothetical protein GYH30_018151 [Glycine max]KAH1241649.1 E3 ubiquitin-protein ligase ATL4 [Glycine max]|eukprot:XP_003530107.1 E3 ubiquitin-protein ligase ATL4 [Glycine max]
MASPPPLSLNVVGSDIDPNTNTFPTVTSSLTPPSPRRSSPLQNLSPSILIIVTVLAVTVIVSLALCFLLRHLNRRCLRRFSSSSAAPSAAATPIFASSRRISPEILHSSASASASVIDTLPLFTFSSVTRRSAAVSGDCAVCLSKFHHHDLLRLLPLCCHAFHAECIDTWLQSNLSCPLCRSTIVADDSDLAKILRPPSSAGSSDSFRLELGNISRRGTDGAAEGGSVARGGSRSYSIGSFEYLIDDESEVPFSHARRRSVDDAKEFPAPAEAPVSHNEASLAGEVGGVRSWLKEYMDRVSVSISSRTASFRGSGRFFSGGGSSDRRSDIVPVAAPEYDAEGNRIGEEISEMFRWLSGV